MRGSQSCLCAQHTNKGSIPAGAGEPTRRAAEGLAPRVYPRGCGGANVPTQPKCAHRGLSPRVRGSLIAASKPDELPGSIPAGAGEPLGAALAAVLAPVYPRGCGGADDDGLTGLCDGGLSPRVRGSRDKLFVHRSARRSIPAGAGEPNHCSNRLQKVRVYPRGCGGAKVFVLSM